VTVPEFKCGDVVCELGQSFFGRAIQWFTRGWFEAKTWASHTGHMVNVGENVYIAEALLHFTIQPLDTARRIKAWRYKPGLTTLQQECMRHKAFGWLGKDYGWWKNAAHAGDGLLEKTPIRYLFKNGHVYLFRRLIGVADYPTCSWATAWTYDECVGYRFGIPPNGAAPDDIADWCEAHPDDWELIFDNVTGA